MVITNEYFKKKDELLFSNRIDNKPVETVEVSLSKMEIAQCSGMKNNKSPHHKIIMELMQKNMYQIRSRMKKQKNAKSGKAEETSVFPLATAHTLQCT